MLKIRKIMSLILVAVMITSLAACGKGKGGTSSETENSVSKGWVNGAPSAPGDVFKLPEIESGGDNAPIIAEITKQSDPGSSVIVTGEGFSAEGTKAYVYAQTTQDDAKTYEADFEVVDDTTVMVTIDSAAKYGVYGVYLENSNGKSGIELVNRPKIWWTDLNAVNAGDSFSVYGENLADDNGGTTHMYLVNDDSYRELEVTYADPYKATAKVPDDLESGKYYKVMLHTSHGGEYGWAEADEKLVYYASPVNEWNGTVIDVTEYGANPADDGADDSAAIQNAVAAAQDGDTIYFPAGTYLCNNTIYAYTYLKFEGEGKDKVNIVMGNNVKKNNGIFNITVTPTEFSGFTFTDIRTTAFEGCFIQANGDDYLSESYNLSIHDCHFVQDTRASLLSKVMSISVQQMSSVEIYNNTAEAAGFLWANGVKKLFVENNEFCGMCYVGNYYGQGPILFWNVDMVDASNNKFYGGDLLTDDSGELTKGDRTLGRTFAIQQSARNVYIANNTMERTGLPADNAGEQIMLEDIPNVYLGGVASATTDTITVSEALTEVPKKNSIVTVVSGKGVTQWRYVKTVKGNVITLSEPWDIIPDSTSKVMISKCFDNFAIYNNVFDGFKNHTTDPTATCAVQLYGSTHNTFITDNVMKNLAYGVCVTSHYITEKGRETSQNGIYWTQIDNNEISNVSIGIRHVLAKVSPAGAGEIPMRTSFGVTEKGNTFSDIVDFTASNKKTLGGAAILIGTANLEYIGQHNIIWSGEWEHGTLIENNTFANCALANVLCYDHQGGTVLKNNTASGKITDIYTIATGGRKPIIFD